MLSGKIQSGPKCFIFSSQFLALSRPLFISSYSDNLCETLFAVQKHQNASRTFLIFYHPHTICVFAFGAIAGATHKYSKQRITFFFVSDFVCAIL